MINPDITETNGACHCGAVRFHVKLGDGLRSARRCTCSFCRMRGAIAVTTGAGGVEVTQGEDVLGCYQFNTMKAKHYFCSKCGIYTHHRKRSNPNEFAVNVACLEGISPFDFDEVLVLDGANHPMDGTPLRLAGTLKFVANNQDQK